MVDSTTVVEDEPISGQGQYMDNNFTESSVLASSANGGIGVLSSSSKRKPTGEFFSKRLAKDQSASRI